MGCSASLLNIENQGSFTSSLKLSIRPFCSHIILDPQFHNVDAPQILLQFFCMTKNVTMSILTTNIHARCVKEADIRDWLNMFLSGLEMNHIIILGVLRKLTFCLLGLDQLILLHKFFFSEEQIWNLVGKDQGDHKPYLITPRWVVSNMANLGLRNFTLLELCIGELYVMFKLYFRLGCKEAHFK